MRAYAHRHSADTSRTGKSVAGGRLLRSLQTQKRSGNQALQRLLKSSPSLPSKHTGNAAPASTHLHRYVDPAIYAAAPISVQPKLEINKPGDAYEHEADRVANQVMGTSQPELQRSCSCAGACSECQRKPSATALQMKQNTLGPGDGVAPPIVHDVLQSSGRALDANTRNFMESRFGYDFSGVRIHSDAKAAESANAVGAKAYTVGQHIALGENQYAPQTNEGRKLLAHELTHVVHQTGGSEGVSRLQRQPAVAKSKNYPFSVKTKGCNGSELSPFRENEIKEAASKAFLKTRDGNCIHNDSLREDILSKYDGLEIVCKDDSPDACGEATGTFSYTLNLYRTAFDSGKCPDVEVTIFHEVIHFTQSPASPHGNLSWDCAESCYPGADRSTKKRGTPSGCDYETGRLPSISVSRGRAFPRKGPSTSYLRFYAGFEKRRWIASYIDLSVGAAVSLIGETETGKPGDVTPSSQMFLAAGALRFDPGQLGGLYSSVSLGLGAVKTGSDFGFGKEVAVSGGVRWRMFDLSLNAGVDFDPTRKTGVDKIFTLAATLTIAPKH